MGCVISVGITVHYSVSVKHRLDSLYVECSILRYCVLIHLSMTKYQQLHFLYFIHLWSDLDKIWNRILMCDISIV